MTPVAGHNASPSVGGIVWTGIAVMVMNSLVAAHNKTGNALEKLVLVTESRVTFVDGFLAAAVLGG